MKKQILKKMMVFSVVTAVGTMPLFGNIPQAFAANYNGTVTFANQWLGENNTQASEVRNFTSASDTLGAPSPSAAGVYRKLLANFLAWSDMQPNADGSLAEGARIFLPSDTIETAFPDGIDADSKLYGVYFKVPYPSSIWDGLAFLNGEFMNGVNDENVVTINSDMRALDAKDGTLPDTSLVDYVENGREVTVVDKYVPKDDNESIHEVVLSSDFAMNKEVALLVYHNPTSGYGNTIDDTRLLTRNYRSLYENGFPMEDSGYTYTDLVIELDNRITTPDSFYMTFSSYTYRPLYVLDENNNILNIKNPMTGVGLGND